jgi:diadenosine tetraphosphate (Ap4A) HIT family hydrolase
VEGFTVGIDDWQTAGRAIFHSYTHLIPRRRGAEDSTGGVRHVIPGKGNYRRQDR